MQRTLRATFVVLALSAAIAIPVGLSRFRDSSPTAGLELIPAEISVGGPTSATTTEVVHISLYNHSRRDVVLKSVLTSCTCVSTEPIRDLPIPAQTAKVLEFRVNLPDSGTTSTEIACHLDCDLQPLRCRVFASGRQALPLLRSIRNGNPTFLALATVAEPAKTVIIETRERKGSALWISRLVCELPDVEIEPRDAEERGHDGDDFLDRTYSFDVRWKRIPDSPEFAGKLTATTSGGGEIAVGHLRGSRVSEVTLSPSIARLSPNRRSETVFILPASQAWALNSEVEIPDWLQVESVASDRGPCLQLSVRKGAVPVAQSVILRINSDQGLHAELKIIVDGFQ